MNARTMMLVGGGALLAAALLLATQGDEVPPAPAAAPSPVAGDTDHRASPRPPRRATLEQEASRSHLESSFELENHLRTLRGATPAAALAMRLEGLLSRTTLACREGEQIVQCVVREARLIPLAGTGVEELRPLAGALETLRAGFLVRVRCDGAILGYRFPRACGVRARNLARAVLGAFEFVTPQDPPSAWTASGHDATGGFEARYRRAAGNDGHADHVVVTRAKARYTTLAGLDSRPHRVSGSARAVLARATGRILTARLHETLQIDLGRDLRLRADLRGALVHRAVRELGGAPAGARWDGPWLPPGGEAEDAATLGLDQLAETWRRRLAHVSAVQLVERLAAAPDRDARLQAWRALVWLVRLRPEAASALLRRVRGEPGGAVAAALLNALAAAGHERAQSALLAARNDGSLPAATREAATRAMFQVARPTVALRDAVLAAIERAPRLDGPAATDLLLLGAFAGRGAATAAERLLALEERARTLQATDVWLQALGNSGAPAALAAARRHVTSPDPMLRAAAVTAVRKLRSKDAFTLVRERALRDPSPRVRLAAVAVLATSHRAAARRVLPRLLASETDPRVRRRARAALERLH